MNAEESATPGADPSEAVRALIVALRSPGAVNAGFAEALIALLEATLEHEARSEEGRDPDGAPDHDG